MQLQWHVFNTGLEKEDKRSKQSSKSSSCFLAKLDLCALENVVTCICRTPGTLFSGDIYNARGTHVPFAVTL